MNIRCNPSFSASVFAVVSMLFAACGEETYADMHLATIENDCSQTAQCDPTFGVIMDAINECIKDTSAKLNLASESYRAQYEMKTSRCAAFTGCQYYACASEPNLFSVAHAMQLSYDCQQQTLCKIAQGQPTSPTENDVCFTALANRLDFATVPEKASWEQRATRCATQMGCAYVSCM